MNAAMDDGALCATHKLVARLVSDYARDHKYDMERASVKETRAALRRIRAQFQATGELVAQMSEAQTAEPRDSVHDAALIVSAIGDESGHGFWDDARALRDTLMRLERITDDAIERTSIGAKHTRSASHNAALHIHAWATALGVDPSPDEGAASTHAEGSAVALLVSIAKSADHALTRDSARKALMDTRAAAIRYRKAIHTEARTA